MLLANYVESRDLKPRSTYQLLLCWRTFERFLGHTPDVPDFTDETLNRFLTWYAQDHKPRSVRNYRHALVGLWKWACLQGLIEQPPKRVKSIKVPRHLPEAWSRSQTLRLVRAAEQLTGCFRCGLPRRTVMRALWLTAYDTGLRRGDLLALKKSQVRDGLVVLVVQKTGQAHVCRLSAETQAALEKLNGPEELLFRVAGLRQLYEATRECLRLAGLQGGLQKMRRTGATAVERVERGAAMQFLGHRTPGLAYQSYVDSRLLNDQHPLPPPLLET